MESKSDQPPLVVILGETASGKSALALELAKTFKGEIIAADSRTVYRGLDIGTAKPMPAEQQLVPHHLLDVLTPDQVFTAADFKRFANKAIKQIAGNGRVPFLVGGSGLYIDAVLYDFSFRGGADPALRAALERLSVEELQTLVLEKKLPMPANTHNPRHLVRVLEAGRAMGERKPLRPNTLILGLEIGKEELRARIAKRLDKMFDSGLIDEARTVATRYGWDAPALQASGYQTLRRYIQGEISLDEAKRQFVQSHLQLAKRQRTWFKRNKSIHWISQKEEAVELLTTFLNK
jgi:tRNA dimethylallyltransferase